MNNTQSFPSEIIKKLRTYVYRLIDPRNGETFYVGKGKGDRVFSHMRAEDGLGDDEINKKFERIRQIRNAGFGVEAALIDAYPGLTYIAGGTGGSDFGVMHAEEIIRRYSAEPATFRHKALLITVNRSAAERSLYEATRYALEDQRQQGA